jgi:acyl dehydratase
MRRVHRSQERDEMPMNQALKGKEYEPVTFEVTAEHVTRFAEAIGEARAIFRDADAAKEAGYAGQVAPPTFVTAMQMMASGQVVLDPELGLDYSRVVHGEQAYDWRRPVIVGDALRAVPRLADIYVRGSNEFLVIESDITDASGETVVVGRSVLLSRGTARDAIRPEPPAAADGAR